MLPLLAVPSRPLLMPARIGITTFLEHTSLEDTSPQDASSGGPQQAVRLAYIRAVEQAGGVPVIAPMLESKAATHAFAEGLDGLVVTGGPAVTQGLVTDGLPPAAATDAPALPDELSGNARLRRRSDEWLLDAFEAESESRASFRRPVLGICYGMQLVNARRGGRIWADVERQVDGARTHSQKRGAETHALALREGTHLHRLLMEPGAPQAPLHVNTRHLQALASVGRGLRASATAPDGVIEAIESPDGTFVGVQFHPERLGAPFQPLFHHLVEQAEQAPAAELRAAAPAGAQVG